MTSPVSGRVISLHGEPGEMAPVGAPLVELEIEGEGNVKANGHGAPKVEAKKTEAKKQGDSLSPTGGEGKGLSRRSSEGAKPDEAVATPLASPAVRQRAKELGIDLHAVTGSGAQGHITHADLDAHIASQGGFARTTNAPREGVEEIKIIGLRRKIAEKMQLSKRRIPHFAYVEEIDMTELEDLRAHLNGNRQSGQPRAYLAAVPDARADRRVAGLPADQRAFRRRGGHRASLRAGSHRHRHTNGQWFDRAGAAPCRGDGYLAGLFRNRAAGHARPRQQGVEGRSLRFHHHHHQPGCAWRARHHARHQPSRSRRSSGPTP